MVTMFRSSAAPLLLPLAIHTASVSAGFTNFYFNTTNACPRNDVTCIPGRSMCAHENINDKDYCCETLSDTTANVCYTSPPTCDGEEPGEPSSVQQKCRGVGEQVNDITWCCLKDSEKCTSRTNQINICTSPEGNPIAQVPESLMNDTFSSLLSADPSATSFSIDVSSLAARATATTASGTTESAASINTNAAPSATNANSNDDGSTPTGAIAGGVVGGIAVLAVIAGGIWFFRRKRKAGQGKGSYSSPPMAEKYEIGSGHPVAEMDARNKLYEMDHSNRWEMQELTGSDVPELPSKQARLRELPE